MTEVPAPLSLLNLIATQGVKHGICDVRDCTKGSLLGIPTRHSVYVCSFGEIDGQACALAIPPWFADCAQT